MAKKIVSTELDKIIGMAGFLGSCLASMLPQTSPEHGSKRLLAKQASSQRSEHTRVGAMFAGENISVSNVAMHVIDSLAQEGGRHTLAKAYLDFYRFLV